MKLKFKLGLVILFEWWSTLKPSFNIFKTNLFWKVLVTDKRIINKICWAWHHRSIISFTTVYAGWTNVNFYIIESYSIQHTAAFRQSYWLDQWQSSHSHNGWTNGNLHIFILASPNPSKRNTGWTNGNLHTVILSEPDSKPLQWKTNMGEKQ